MELGVLLLLSVSFPVKKEKGVGGGGRMIYTPSFRHLFENTQDKFCLCPPQNECNTKDVPHSPGDKV